MKIIKYTLLLLIFRLYDIPTLVFLIAYKIDFGHLYLLSIYNYLTDSFKACEINNLINLYVFDSELLLIIRVVFSVAVMLTKLNKKEKWIVCMLVNNLRASWLIFVLDDKCVFVEGLLLLRELMVRKVCLSDDCNLNFVGWLDCLITISCIGSLLLSKKSQIL
ncbi:hypothetical protein CDIK_2706 [Cucumispora dikerogammari]|nr:hypothetical protein CDIK_2706 [Cucumispora dikerogammari]